MEKGKSFEATAKTCPSVWNHSGQNVPKLLIAIQLWKDDNLTRISEFHSKTIAQKPKKLAVGCWRDWLFKADFQCMGQFEPGGHTRAFSWNAVGLGWTDLEKCIPRSIHRSMFEFTICPGLPHAKLAARPCTKGLQIWTRNPPSWRHPEGPALGIKASWNLGLRFI